MKKTEILVAGAGAAGLVAAISLARKGFDVTCVGRIDTHANGRTVALFEGSLRFLRATGLWTQFNAQAAALRRIRMIDDTGGSVPIAPADFSAREIGLSAFGANIENDVLVRGLADLAATTPGLTLHDGFLTNFDFDDENVCATRDKGDEITAQFVVAADGRKSLARQAAKIGARPWFYPQVALTVLLAHDKPHRDTSIEFHTRAGPCTLVPLRARENVKHRSSLVWLMTPAEGERRRALPPASLAEEIEQQVHGIFGTMRLDGPPGFFPMAGLRASRLVGRRIALVGETAHAFPPLAAQGLNLSLRDIEALTDTLCNGRQAGHALGDSATLAAYEAVRRGDIALRMNGIDMLNRSLLFDFLPIDLARGGIMLAFGLIGPLRRAIIKEGVLPKVFA